jgi:hypothetical protein
MLLKYAMTPSSLHLATNARWLQPKSYADNRWFVLHVTSTVSLNNTLVITSPDSNTGPTPFLRATLFAGTVKSLHVTRLQATRSI